MSSPVASFSAAASRREWARRKRSYPSGPETMLQRVVRVLSEIVAPIVVVAAVDQELPELPRDVILTRDENEGRGPLEGLRAGLKALPVDIETAYVDELRCALARARIRQSDAGSCERLRHRRDGNRRLHASALRSLPAIDAGLRRSICSRTNRLRPVFLFDAVKTRRVRPEEMTADPELWTLRNLNTREDYELALVEAGLKTSTEVLPR